MTGHVRYHKGSWNAVIYQGRRINSKGKLGYNYRWISGFKTEREAQEEVTRQLSARLEGSYVEPHKMTLKQYLRHWLAVVETSLAPKTFERYNGICEDNIIPALGAFQLVKLTAIDIEGFYSHMLKKGRQPRFKKQSSRGLSPTTVLQFHRVLHKALQDAVHKKIVSHNVADAAQAPRKAQAEINAPDEERMALLLERVRQDARVYLPTLIACGSGLRRGEILALRWRDINLITGAARIIRSLCQLKTGQLIFKDVKRKKNRRVLVLPEFVIEALREALVEQQQNRKLFGKDYQDQDLVCCLPDGSPIPPDTVTSAFRYHRLALGLKTRFHDLRHGHASQALQDGVPIKTVQERLGHSTAAFTLDVYGHLLPGADERAAASTQRTLGAAIERQRQKSVN
ncbi:MAG TPA: site-specific integrase [Candidatus Eisenbacteria bacterium]|jgi:integrase|nr:site-specific integrase [Candidatus Eisenbacteria bacterium]